MNQEIDKRETFGQFAERLGIKMRSRFLGTVNNPIGGRKNDWPTGTRKWYVTLIHEKRKMSVTFHKGPALTEAPELEEVLYCLASDASLVDEDPETYANAQDQTDRLKHFLGSDFEAFVHETREA